MSFLRSAPVPELEQAERPKGKANRATVRAVVFSGLFMTKCYPELRTVEFKISPFGKHSAKKALTSERLIRGGIIEVTRGNNV